jgi:hypothetical protein
MNTDEHNPLPDGDLDELFRAVREDQDFSGGVAFALETRVLARLREERRGSWLALAWRLCPYVAALAIAAGIWSYASHDDPLESESLYAAVRLAGMPVIDYYLGDDE